MSHRGPDPEHIRPVPASRASVESNTRTSSHGHSCSAVGAHITSFWTGDLVVPKLPAFGYEMVETSL